MTATAQLSDSFATFGEGHPPIGKEPDVIIAAYARTLRPGVTLDQFVAAWKPEGDDLYPAGVEIAVDPGNYRRILTLIKFDGSLDELQAAMPRLIHAESHARLAQIIESTELESIYTLATTVE